MSLKTKETYCTTVEGCPDSPLSVIRKYVYFIHDLKVEKPYSVSWPIKKKVLVFTTYYCKNYPKIYELY